AHPAEDPLPGAGDVGLLGVRPAEGLADAVLPLGAAGDHGPGLDAEAAGPHRLPDVDVGVADHQHVFAVRAGGDGIRDSALFRTLHQMVHEHTDLAAGARIEVADD